MSCWFRFRQWSHDLCRPARSLMSHHWVWFASAAVFVLYFFIGGFMYCYCILFGRLQDEFHYNAALTGWLGALTLCFATISSPISIYLTTRRSPRAVAVAGVLLCGFASLISSYMRDFFALFFTYGTLYGLGANFVYQSTTTLLLMDHRGEDSIRSSGIAMTGTSIGLMVLSSSLDHLMTTHGWRITLRTMAVVILTICTCSCIVLVKPDEEKLRQLREQLKRSAMIERSLYPAQCAPQDSKRIEIMRSRDMRWFFIAYTLTATAWAVYIIHCVPFAISIELEYHQGALLVFVYAAMTVIGKHVLYLLNKYVAISRIYILIIANMVSSVVSFCFLFSKTMGQLVPLFIVLGLLAAVFQGLPYATAVELFLDTRPSELSALIMVGLAIGFLIGGPMAGGLYDQTGNYNVSFLVVAFLYIFATILLTAIPIGRTIKSRRQRELEARALNNQGANMQPRYPAGCRCHLMITGHEERLSVFDNISTV